jgi:hypothetical protein
MHLVGCQLCRKGAHLLVDVILPYALGECGELAFDVCGVLALQGRGSKLMGAGAMTRRAGWNPALRIAGEDKADSRIALPQATSAFRDPFSGYGRQPVCAAAEIRCHVSRILNSQGGGDGAHDAPKALARTIVVELFVDYRRIHSREAGDKGGWAHASLAVAGATIERDEGAPLLAARGNLRKCGARPSNTCRRANRRLRLGRRPGIGGNADCATDRVPCIERGTVQLVSGKHDEAQDERNAEQRRGEPPANPGPGIIEVGRILTDHHCRPFGSDGLETAMAGTECCFRKKNCPIG